MAMNEYDIDKFGYTPPSIQNHVGDILMHTIRKRIEPDVLRNLEVERFVDMLVDDVVYDFRLFLASKTTTSEKTVSEEKADGPVLIKCDKEKTIKVPCTWWDAFKQRWLPSWKYNWFEYTLETKFHYHTTNHITTKQVFKTTNICPHLAVDPKHDHFSFLVTGRIPNAL